MTEPLVVLPISEVKRLIAEAVADAVGPRMASNGADEKPVSVKQTAKALGTGADRVRRWCKEGCEECGERLPSIMTSDERGRKLYLSDAREWIAHHRSERGCRG